MIKIIKFIVRYSFEKQWSSFYAQKMAKDSENWNWKIVNQDIQLMIDSWN